MSKIVYVVTCDGEPYRVYSDQRQVFHMCQAWLVTHRTDYDVEEGFSFWCDSDGRHPETDEEYAKAWKEYIDMEFESGTWGDYAWYEVLMD